MSLLYCLRSMHFAGTRLGPEPRHGRDERRLGGGDCSKHKSTLSMAAVVCFGSILIFEASDFVTLLSVVV